MSLLYELPQPPPPLAGLATARTVLMIEDNLALRDMIRGLVDNLPDLNWFGGCGTLADARRALASARKPDLILLDLSLPDGSGHEILTSPAVRQGKCRVAFATGCKDPVLLRHCENPAVVGFIDKFTSRLVDWRAALKNLASGGTYFSSSYQALTKPPPAPKPDAKSTAPRLTPRERELLTHFVTGASDAAVANQLELATSTVRSGRHRLMKKLGIADVAEFKLWQHLLNPPES